MKLFRAYIVIVSLRKIVEWAACTLTCLINVHAPLAHSYVLSKHARLLGRWEYVNNGKNVFEKLSMLCHTSAQRQICCCKGIFPLILQGCITFSTGSSFTVISIKKQWITILTHVLHILARPYSHPCTANHCTTLFSPMYCMELEIEEYALAACLGPWNLT